MSKYCSWSSPKVSSRLFRRRDGYRTADLQRVCLRRIPGGENTLADGVVGGVELVFRELGRDVCAAVGGNRDADVGSLVFDFADGACDRRTIDRFARLFQHQTIIANGEGLVAKGNDIVAADEFRREFRPGVVEDFARRTLLFDPATIH